MLETMGFEISWPKYRISRKYVHYCQDFGMAPRLQPSMKVDCVRLRLLNQFRKMGSHKNFEHPDTLVGKALELEKVQEYLEDKVSTTKDLWWAETLELFQKIVPVAVTAAMPSFAENSVMKSAITYMPSWLGGLGLPDVIDWTESQEACMVAKSVHYRRLGYHTEEEPDTVWHRGMLIPACYEKAINAAPGIYVEQFSSVWSKTKSESLERGLTEPSNRNIAKRIHKEWVDISRPTNIVGQKESAYSAVYRGTQRQPVRHHRRARHLVNLSRRYARRHAQVDDVLPWPTDMAEYRVYRSGAWVLRTDYQAFLGVPFACTRATLSKEFFGGRAGLYEAEHNERVDETFFGADLFSIVEEYANLDSMSLGARSSQSF